jgi:hypothetical protein
MLYFCLMWEVVLAGATKYYSDQGYLGLGVSGFDFGEHRHGHG